MGAGVGKPVIGDDGSERPAGTAAVEVRLLGPMAVALNSQPIDLPPSRKVRALFGYLALAPQAVTRSTCASCSGMDRAIRVRSCAGA